MRQRIVREEIGKAGTLRRGEVQLLAHDPAPFGDIDRQFVGGIACGDAVGHQTLCEVEKKILLRKVKNSIVIQTRHAARTVANLDCVVAEAFPHLLAGAEGVDGDIEIAAGNAVQRLRTHRLRKQGCTRTQRHA